MPIEKQIHTDFFQGSRSRRPESDRPIERASERASEGRTLGFDTKDLSHTDLS